MKIPFLASALAGAGLVVLSALGRTASAQCPTPDWLDDFGICIFAVPNLPDFPAVQALSTEICWNSCIVDSQNAVLAKWGRLRPAQTRVIPPLCTVYIARLDLVDPVTGTNEWGGAIRCFYSRTWVERDAAGREIQVWRFLTNGDLRPTAAAGPTPCPVPPCAAAFSNRVHFSGHLDVAVTCSSGQRAIAWSLNHDCDPFEHGPDSARPGSFHVGGSYTFVGPSASFVAGSVAPEPTASTTSEAVRQLALSLLLERPPSAMICLAEQNLVSATLTAPSSEFCPCGAFGSGGYVQRVLTVNSGTVGLPRISAGGSEFTSRGIGRWTDPNAFPGLEELRVNWGSYAMGGLCRDIVPPSAEFFAGVSTIGGFSAFGLTGSGVGGPLPAAFVDQASSVDSNDFLPVKGTKYVSSVILNLNF